MSTLRDSFSMCVFFFCCFVFLQTKRRFKIKMLSSNHLDEERVVIFKVIIMGRRQEVAAPCISHYFS